MVYIGIYKGPEKWRKVFFIAKSKNEIDILERLKKLKHLKKSDIEPFIKWCEIMFLGNDDVYEYIDENLNKEDENMLLAELGPKFVALCREEGKKEGIRQSLLKILPKKLNRILPLDLENSIKNADLEKLEELEDKIFEINSIEDVKIILS